MRKELIIPTNVKMSELNKESDKQTHHRDTFSRLIALKLGIYSISSTADKTFINIDIFGNIYLWINEYAYIDHVLSDISSNIKIIYNIKNYKYERAGIFREFIKSKIDGKDEKFNYKLGYCKVIL